MDAIMKTLVFFAILHVTVPSDQVVRYDNYQVYRLLPKNEDQLSTLRTLRDDNPSYSFWTDPVKPGLPVDVMVPPNLKLDFRDLLELQNLTGEVYIEDVQEVIEETTYRGKVQAVNWMNYNTLDEINNWMRELEQSHPEAKVVKGGRTYEGRDILGVHVSFNKANENRAVFIEGGIHARDSMISPAVVTYILNEVLTSTDPAVRKLVENYDWYIFPNFNPDGYVYTFTRNRLWRKTRRPYGFCVGADPNRNWDWQWMTGGSSMNPCLDTFAGTSAFSEVETKSMSQYITSIKEKLVAYIAFHSYSQLLLIPYGDRRHGRCENYSELKEVGDKAATSLAKRYGTVYTVGNIIEVIYEASGDSMDWVKGKYGTRITYTYELRDKGRYGFLLPKDQIIPTCEETMDSLITILTEFESRPNVV